MIMSYKMLPLMLYKSNYTSLCGDDSERNPGSGTQTLVRPGTETKEPKMYKVLLLNDDFTPMDIVVHILVKIFRRSETEANKIMLQVHTKGSGIAGVYSHEIAETKAFQASEFARQNEYPLQCIIEEEN